MKVKMKSESNESKKENKKDQSPFKALRGIYRER